MTEDLPKTIEKLRQQSAALDVEACALRHRADVKEAEAIAILETLRVLSCAGLLSEY